MMVPIMYGVAFLVFLGVLYDFTVDNLDDRSIASKGALNAQLSIVTSQMGTKRTQQEQEITDSDQFPKKCKIKCLMWGLEKKLEDFMKLPLNCITYPKYLCELWCTI